MKFITAPQGSAEWLDVRKTTRNASEAPAMKGVCPHTSYLELVARRATGVVGEVLPEQQNRFDKGHRAEAHARKKVEAMLGKSLYALTATDDAGYLLASSDGCTMPPIGGIGFENKLWNKENSVLVLGGEVPEWNKWQLDQQIAVFGFEKIIFSVCDDAGENFACCEYRTTPERIASLMAGWKQFDEDVANFRPEPVEAKPILVAKSIDTLPSLMIEIAGRVTASNLVEFKGHATAVISSINTSLQTDQDFVDATKAAKYLRDVEDNAKRAKANALSQTASIDELFKALDDVIKMAADVRKDLEKKITQEKDARKTEMVLSAKLELAEYVGRLRERNAHMQDVTADFPAAIKGLSSIDSMRSKIAAAMAGAKIVASELDAKIKGNLESIFTDSHDWRFLFPDLNAVCAKAPEDFAALVSLRVAKHKEVTAKAMEADRERIRAEEAEKLAKAEADNKAKIEAAERAAKDKADSDAKIEESYKKSEAEEQNAKIKEAAKSLALAPKQNEQEKALETAKERAEKPAIAKFIDLFDHITDLLSEMDDDEMTSVLVFCQEVVANRKAAA